MQEENVFGSYERSELEGRRINVLQTGKKWQCITSLLDFWTSI